MKKRKGDGTLKLISRDQGADRLSGLPADVIGHILAFLPTPQAVLTSLLSRRWRRVWAEHARALDLSVQDCKWFAYCGLSREALARFPSIGIPSLSLEFDSHVFINGKANAWYGEAMARAVGSVRVRVPRGLAVLELPLCTRAEALTLRLNHWLVLQLPLTPVLFGGLTELSLSAVRLQYTALMPPPFHEFLSSCCPRLRRLRLCCVRGDALRRLVIRSDVLEDLDLDNVDALTTVDVVAANLRSLSVRSCFRFPCIREEAMEEDDEEEEEEEESEVVVSAPRMEAICWYRSYPKRLDFPAGLKHVRRLSGLKLPTLGRRDQFDFPYTIQLLQACSLTAQHLDLDLIVPDQMALLNWLGPGHHRPEDLMGYVPQLPRVSVLSLTLRWGLGVSVTPSLASLLSRLPALSRLHLRSSPYSQTVLERQETRNQPRGGEFQWGGGGGKDEELMMISMCSLREMSVDGLKGADNEECRVVELLLRAAAAAPPSSSLEKISLTFCDTTAVPVAHRITAEVQARFPMVTGRWANTAGGARELSRKWTKGKTDMHVVSHQELITSSGNIRDYVIQN